MPTQELISTLHTYLNHKSTEQALLDEWQHQITQLTMPSALIPYPIAMPVADETVVSSSSMGDATATLAESSTSNLAAITADDILKLQKLLACAAIIEQILKIKIPSSSSIQETSSSSGDNNDWFAALQLIQKYLENDILPILARWTALRKKEIVDYLNNLKHIIKSFNILHVYYLGHDESEKDVEIDFNHIQQRFLFKPIYLLYLQALKATESMIKAHYHHFIAEIIMTLEDVKTVNTLPEIHMSPALGLSSSSMSSPAVSSLQITSLSTDRIPHVAIETYLSDYFAFKPDSTQETNYAKQLLAMLNALSSYRSGTFFIYDLSPSEVCLLLLVQAALVGTLTPDNIPPSLNLVIARFLPKETERLVANKTSVRFLFHLFYHLYAKHLHETVNRRSIAIMSNHLFFNAIETLKISREKNFKHLVFKSSLEIAIRDSELIFKHLFTALCKNDSNLLRVSNFFKSLSINLFRKLDVPRILDKKNQHVSQKFYDTLRYLDLPAFTNSSQAVNHICNKLQDMITQIAATSLFSADDILDILLENLFELFQPADLIKLMGLIQAMDNTFFIELKDKVLEVSGVFKIEAYLPIREWPVLTNNISQMDLDAKNEFLLTNLIPVFAKIACKKHNESTSPLLVAFRRMIELRKVYLEIIKAAKQIFAYISEAQVIITSAHDSILSFSFSPQDGIIFYIDKIKNLLLSIVKSQKSSLDLQFIENKMYSIRELVSNYLYLNLDINYLNEIFLFFTNESNQISNETDIEKLITYKLINDFNITQQKFISTIAEEVREGHLIAHLNEGYRDSDIALLLDFYADIIHCFQEDTSKLAQIQATLDPLKQALTSIYNDCYRGSSDNVSVMRGQAATSTPAVNEARLETSIRLLDLLQFAANTESITTSSGQDSIALSSSQTNMSPENAQQQLNGWLQVLVEHCSWRQITNILLKQLTLQNPVEAQAGLILTALQYIQTLLTQQKDATLCLIYQKILTLLQAEIRLPVAILHQQVLEAELALHKEPLFTIANLPDLPLNAFTMAHSGCHNWNTTDLYTRLQLSAGGSRLTRRSLPSQAEITDDETPLEIIETTFIIINARSTLLFDTRPSVSDVADDRLESHIIDNDIFKNIYQASELLMPVMVALTSIDSTAEYVRVTLNNLASIVLDIALLQKNNRFIDAITGKEPLPPQDNLALYHKILDFQTFFTAMTYQLCHFFELIHINEKFLMAHLKIDTDINTNIAEKIMVIVKTTLTSIKFDKIIEFLAWSLSKLLDTVQVKMRYSGIEVEELAQFDFNDIDTMLKSDEATRRSISLAMDYQNVYVRLYLDFIYLLHHNASIYDDPWLIDIKFQLHSTLQSYFYHEGELFIEKIMIQSIQLLNIDENCINSDYISLIKRAIYYLLLCQAFCDKHNLSVSNFRPLDMACIMLIYISTVFNIKITNAQDSLSLAIKTKISALLNAMETIPSDTTPSSRQKHIIPTFWRLIFKNHELAFQEEPLKSIETTLYHKQVIALTGLLTKLYLKHLDYRFATGLAEFFARLVTEETVNAIRIKMDEEIQTIVEQREDVQEKLNCLFQEKMTFIDINIPDEMERNRKEENSEKIKHEEQNLRELTKTMFSYDMLRNNFATHVVKKWPEKNVAYETSAARIKTDHSASSSQTPPTPQRSQSHPNQAGSSSGTRQRSSSFWSTITDIFSPASDSRSHARQSGSSSSTTDDSKRKTTYRS